MYTRFNLLLNDIPMTGLIGEAWQHLGSELYINSGIIVLSRNSCNAVLNWVYTH